MEGVILLFFLFSLSWVFCPHSNIRGKGKWSYQILKKFPLYKDTVSLNCTGLLTSLTAVTSAVNWQEKYLSCIYVLLQICSCPYCTIQSRKKP